MSIVVKILLVSTFLFAVLARNPDNIPTLKTDLQQKIDKYDKDLDALSAQVKKVQGQLAEAKGQSSFDFSSIQEGVANERDILNTISGYLTLPFNISSTECYDLSESQKKRITKQVTAIESGLGELESNTAFTDECKEYQRIKTELTRQKTYIESIRVALLSKGCGERPKRVVNVTVLTPSGIANIAQSQFQTNLKADNLCYGKLTQEKVKLLWFAYTVKNNVTNCPLQTPFYDGVKCIQCTGDKAFWDLSLRRCIGAKGVDANKQCIEPSIGGIKAGTDDDNKNNNTTPTESAKEIPATYKDVEVDPLTEDPIVKSVTINKNKKTVQKIVDPIEGKAILEKEKKIINTKYEEVKPEQSEAEYQIIRKKVKSTTSIEEVDPIESEPLVETKTVKKSTTTSRKWGSSSSSNSGSSSSSNSASSGSSSGSASLGGHSSTTRSSTHSSHLYEI